jgi:hypothetical protein
LSLSWCQQLLDIRQVDQCWHFDPPTHQSSTVPVQKTNKLNLCAQRFTLSELAFLDISWHVTVNLFSVMLMRYITL